MHEFDGVRRFSGPPADVAARLSDAAFLARCLPDAEVSHADADRAALRVRPKGGLLPGHLDVTIDVVGREPGVGAGFRIVSRAMGASGTVAAGMAFAAADGGGTAVNWTAQLTEVTGLLRMVPGAVLRTAAGRVIDEVWEAVERGVADGR